MLASLADILTDKITHNEGHFVLTLSQPFPLTESRNDFSEKKYVIRMIQKIPIHLSRNNIIRKNNIFRKSRYHILRMLSRLYCKKY